MANDVIIQAQIKPELKLEVEDVFTRLGLTTNEAINLFFQQVKSQGGLPFDVRSHARAKTPNETTFKTFRDTDASKNLVEYDSLDNMFADLEK